MASSDEITQTLKEAASIVDGASLPADLRPVAFDRVLGALGLTHGVDEAHMRIPNEEQLTPNQKRGEAEGLLTRMGARLGIDVSILTEIYAEADGQIRLILGPGMLPDPTRKAASMRDVGLLVAVARQASGFEDYTPLKVIRDECEELGVLDGTNFATEIGRLGFRLQGGRNTREAKVNRRHYEDAAALIRTIVERRG